MLIGEKHIGKRTGTASYPKICRFCNGIIDSGTPFVSCYGIMGTYAWEWDVHEECDFVASKLRFYARHGEYSNGVDSVSPGELYLLVNPFVKEHVCDSCPKRFLMGESYICRSSEDCIHEAAKLLKSSSLVQLDDGRWSLVDMEEKDDIDT